MELYNELTPYHKTPVVNNRLDIMVDIEVPKLPDDRIFTISRVYHLRPDLLAYDLYGHSELWWVFARRNMNILVDPLMDFVEGTVIFLPQKPMLDKALGLS